MTIPPQPQVPFADWLAEKKVFRVSDVPFFVIQEDLAFRRRVLNAITPAPPSPGAQQRHSDGAVPERSL